MCGCNLQALAEGNHNISANEIISNQDNRDFLAEKKMIDKQNFKSGKKLAVLQYLYCLNEKKFKAVFKSFGVTVTAEDLPAIADIVDRGADLVGEIYNDNRQQVFFNVMNELGKIEYTKEEFASAQCSIVLT